MVDRVCGLPPCTGLYSTYIPVYGIDCKAPGPNRHRRVHSVDLASFVALCSIALEKHPWPVSGQVYQPMAVVPCSDRARATNAEAAT